MFDKLFTWSFIGSFIGMVAAVCLLTYLLKDIFDKLFGKIKTEKLVYFIALFVVGIVVATTEKFNAAPWQAIAQRIFTSLLNSILVSFVAMKSYDNVLSKIPTFFEGKGGSKHEIGN